MEPPAPVPPPAVLLLTLWCHGGRPWHARLVDGQARVHDFDSPFELARFLCRPAPASEPGEPGLR